MTKIIDQHTTKKMLGLRIQKKKKMQTVYPEIVERIRPETKVR